MSFKLKFQDNFWKMASKQILLGFTLLCLLASSANAGCQDKLDVVAVIDGSDSINAIDFQIFKNALIDFVNKLNIHPDFTRFGLVLYSSNVPDRILISGDATSINNKIGNLVQPRDGTNTHLGLIDMANMIKVYSRPNGVTIGLVITDGDSKDPTKTKNEAKYLRDLGVSMFAIGVGDKINTVELNDIASPNQVRRAQDFNQLSSILGQLLPTICPATTTPPPTTRAAPITSAPTADAALCAGCKRDNGIGYNNHVSNCQKYIQCSFDTGTAIAQIRDCGIGLYWDQKILSCNFPSAVQCVNDPCRNTGTTHYKSTKNCRQYYSCEDKAGLPLCCPAGKTFNQGTNQCEFDSFCTAYCGPNPSPPITACNMRAVAGKPHVYEEELPVIGWIERPCATGSHFNKNTCHCSDLADTPAFVPTIAPVTVNSGCKAMLELKFDNGVKDTSGNFNWVQNVGVKVENGLAYFDGNSYLRVPRFSNVPLGTTFMMKIRYRAEGSVFNQQALITNRDCGKPGSIAILLNQQTTSFVVRNGNGISSTVPMNVASQGQWREVIYRVENGVLSGNIDGQTRTATMVGSIGKSECALQVGHGITYSNFKGYMDDVKVYMC